MRIGIIGGGQLAQMMALAGYPLGFQVLSLETNDYCPAASVCEIVIGEYIDQEKLQLLASRTDILTYEFENIPVSMLERIDAPIYPPLKALGIAQDRLLEKNFFNHLSIPTTHYFAVNSLQELKEAISSIGLPAVLKTRTLGYDGKGQVVIRKEKDIELAWEALKGQALLVENLIAFDREVSCIAVRARSGEIVFYPLSENQHADGILKYSKVLAADEPTGVLAQSYLKKIFKELDYVGVLTLEFFEKDGKLFANEMAPRVHNSGHWTINGAHTSQFENHLRAIVGLPLGSTAALGHVAMLNLIGSTPSLSDLLSIPEARCHIYGKEARPGRKLGHVTFCVENEELLEKRLRQMRRIVDRI